MTATFTNYRLAIEGWGAEAVTSPAMEGTGSDGTSRIRGLLREGLMLEEQCDLAAGETESGGMTITIVEQPGEEWCEHCARQPSVGTWLTSDVDATSFPVTVDVDSSASFTAGEYAHMGTECFLVFSIPSSTELELAGGARGTQRQAHYVKDGANLVNPVITETHPTTLEGRRVFLYEYQDGDDLQGDGTLIWRGIATTDFQLEQGGTRWSMQVDSIFALFQQDVGGDAEKPFGLRGYYYSFFAPLILNLYRVTPGDFTPALEHEQLIITGHFETVDDLCDEINSQATAVQTWTDAIVSSSFAAVPIGDGYWGVRFETDSSETELLWVVADEVRGGLTPLNVTQDYYADGALGTAALWTLKFEKGMIAPRGVWGPHSGAIAYAAPTEDNNQFTIYPDGTTLLNFGDIVTLESDSDDAPSWTVTRDDDAEQRYEISLGPDRPAPFFAPELDNTPSFKRFGKYVRGTLADFRDALIANAPADANRGAAPFVTSTDLASWDAEVERAATSAGSLAQRDYTIAQSVKLGELIAHECRLLGLFPRLDSDGKIALGYLELPTESTPADFELDETNILASDETLTWERNGIWGSINTVEVLTGYNPQEDDHLGPTYRVRDVTSLSVVKTSKELKIEPLSGDTVDYDEDAVNQIVTALRRTLSVFGRPYSILTVQVPWTLRTTALVGTVCSITSHRIPNVRTGVRGVSNVKGMVTGRAWDLARGVGTLTIIVSDAQLLGYTPTAAISASSPTSATKYTLTVALESPDGVSLAPSGLTLADAFPAGTRIEVMEWDSSSQTPQPATVASVGPSDMDVTFDSAPTLTGTRYIRYAAASEVTAEAQKSWAYMADTDSFVSFSGGDVVAGEFAP